MFHSNSNLTRMLVFCLAAWCVATGASAGVSFATYSFYRRLDAGTFASQEQIEAEAGWIDAVVPALAWASVGIFLATVVVFCLWTYRAAANAKLLSSLPMRISPGWAVGWYFVPFANFWMPFRGMREIWMRSAWPPKKYAPVALNLWWILWIAVSFLNGAVNRNAPTENLNILATFEAIAGIVSAIWLIPTALLIWIVLRVQAMQVAKHTANPDGPPEAMRAFEEASTKPVSAV